MRAARRRRSSIRSIAGRRIFGAGINLTHLYQGKIPFVWFLQRDIGFVHKFQRGVARPDALPDDMHGQRHREAVDRRGRAFAIGGHCQVLLTMDYVLAADDAYMTLPARKEGIIPGVANLRLPRFTGDRLARQLIRTSALDCDSAGGPPDLRRDRAGRRDGCGDRAVVDRLTGSGVVSAAGNRRAFRADEEPLDAVPPLLAVYAREQAYCHFSPALIANLERYWDAQNRKG